MRGDRLARQWRMIWGIEASPNGLTAAEIGQREESGIRTIYLDLEAIQAAGIPLYAERAKQTNRWAFIDTFKSKFFASYPICSESMCCNKEGGEQDNSVPYFNEAFFYIRDGS